jgi:lipoprotein-anchoring transpeptidase ErfK/SrfK
MMKTKQCFLLVSFLFLPVSIFSMPQHISPMGEKVIIVDPREHRFGAYDASGNLLRSGLASAGADWCNDMDAPCHTETGTFRILSLGSSKCTSPSFPMPSGGAPMPYCMYFTHDQALHGSYEVVDGNISHGCVRLHVSDAAWLRFHFAEHGTLVLIESY